MNSILEKCITELKNEAPRIDYVLGMLETLQEMQTPAIPTGVAAAAIAIKPPYTATGQADDTSPILDAYASGPIGKLDA